MRSRVAHQGHGLPASSHFYKTTKLGAATMSVMNLNPRIGLSFDGQCEAAFKFLRALFEREDCVYAPLGRIAHGQRRASGMEREDSPRQARHWRYRLTGSRCPPGIV